MTSKGILKPIKTRITEFISKQPGWFFVVFASLAAFSAYSCMYAFRKPFTLCLFEGMYFWGIQYKIWLITAQVVGYTLSKFIGISYISGLKKDRRAISILVLIAIAELALVLFKLIPSPYNIMCLFLNGLPLGIIWGIVFSYLEGRKVTELLGAILSASFILASGFVKTVGNMVIHYFHASQFSMPYITGLLFIIPLAISVFLMDCVPGPTVTDEAARSRRQPMNKTFRLQFLRMFWPGLVLLVLTYILLTVFRELRDNFAPELWYALGYGNDLAIFAKAEVPVTIVTLSALALVIVVENNYKALQVIFVIVVTGFLLTFLSSILYVLDVLDGKMWMITMGIGLYLGYIPFNAFLYERLIATFKTPGNIGFVMYVSDSFGYLGSLGVVLFKNFHSPQVSWVSFFSSIGIWYSLLGILFMLASSNYFYHIYKTFKHESNNKPEHTSGKPLFAFNSGTSFNQ